MTNNEKEEYYGGPFVTIPQYILLDNEIEPNARLLYGLIVNLSGRDGYCLATNEYLAEKFKVDIRSIQNWLGTLKNKDLISINIELINFNNLRKIYIKNH